MTIQTMFDEIRDLTIGVAGFMTLENPQQEAQVLNAGSVLAGAVPFRLYPTTNRAELVANIARATLGVFRVVTACFAGSSLHFGIRPIGTKGDRIDALIFSAANCLLYSFFVYLDNRLNSYFVQDKK